MTDNWYQMSGEAVAEKLQTSAEKGLTRKACRTLLRKYKKNEIYPVSKITFYNCLKSITMDYTSYLLVITALIAALFEESVSAWSIVVLVALNLIATLIAYTKAQKTLEGMDRYTLPVVRVIREGRLYMIDQKQLVPGDLICLSRGDIVPADARIIKAEGFFVDETHLFGRGPLRLKEADDGIHETLAAEKQRNMVFASTLVVGGEAQAIICATGEDTVVCITDKNRPIVNHETMPLLGMINKISRVWSLVVIAAVFFLTLIDFLMPGLHNSLFSSFIKSMSFAVSTMSEMYVAFGYIVLACGVMQSVHHFRENESGAIIKNPLSMENLRHLTCLVIPKEGVLTTRESIVDRIYAGDHLYDITDRKARRVMERPILYSILSTGMYGLAYLQAQSSGKMKDRANTEEETAILNLARSMDVYNVRLDRAYQMIDHKSAGGESYFDTTLVNHKERYIAISRGEPEALLKRCSYYYKDGTILLLTPQTPSQTLLAYRKLVRQAYSAVGVASRIQMYNTLRFLGAAQSDMVFEGIVAFRTPYLRGAAQLVEDAKEAGIKIILLSERTAAAEAYFAKQLGIIEDREHCIDGAALRASKEGIRRTNASYYRLYCGLDTQQKMELLEHLHEDGEVIGVLGRRLEDLCLLRAADVSFAQNIAVQTPAGAGKHETIVSKVSESAGEDGCEALKFESDLIVSDADQKGSGGFRGILDAIRIAKNTDLQVIRIVRYLLTSQIARFILVLYTILFAKDGMSAVQALFAGLFADCIAVMIFAFQRPESDILRSSMDAVPWLEHPIRSNIPSVLTGVCWACTSILSSFFCAWVGLAATEQETGSILFVTSTIIQIIMLFSVQRDDFLWKPGIRMSALQGLYLLSVVELFLLFFLFPNFGTMFGVVKFDMRAAIPIGIFCLIMMIMAECVKMLARMRERPEIAAEEEQNSEHRSQIAELFRAFRKQKEEEEREAYGPKAKRVRRRKKPKKTPPEPVTGTIAEAVPETASAEETETGAEPTDVGATAMEATSAGAETPTEEQPGTAQTPVETPEKVNHPHSFLASLFAQIRNEDAADSGAPRPDTAEMEAYVEQERAKSGRHRHRRGADESAKPKKNSSIFREDDADLDLLQPKHTLSEDDALAAAMQNRPAFGARQDITDVEEPDEIMLLPDDVEDLVLPAEIPDKDGIPDPDAFDAAVAAGFMGDRETDSEDGEDSDNGNITVRSSGAAVRGFLRNETAPVRFTEEEADREFPGLGYLFSEDEYEAIMAEYNKDGVHRNLYDTETQSFHLEDPENISLDDIKKSDK
ncbi:MAG: cation-transporting P-type ATPase [Clostridia bacterium]|nr:cation-transporting P-type ATPase [Clostridia bacterium]